MVNPNKVAIVRPKNTALTPQQVITGCMGELPDIEEVVVLVRYKNGHSGRAPLSLKSSSLSVETAAVMGKMFERQVNQAIDALL